ncbi:protein phosphatase 1 regulatory subunit 12B-like [Ylistrum balloti]|uniref:protein phosphatase 1 regulatory subunit 12B-like n=1 Tax=Ylistrum balloti TaxID=509963 RepID=UPI002905E321|nr:protein phosphatase 1 regulatory subunit 12B-like [Ylistrum balloti]
MSGVGIDLVGNEDFSSHLSLDFIQKNHVSVNSFSFNHTIPSTIVKVVNGLDSKKSTGTVTGARSLLRLLEDWCQALDNNKYVGAILMDLSKCKRTPILDDDIGTSSVYAVQDTEDKEGALCSAVENKDAEKVLDLLKLGHKCHPNSRNKVTCLHIACQRGYLDITRHLLDNGFNIGDLTKDYRTPLHEAVDRGHVPVARELLKRKASTELKDIFSHTPLFIACENGDTQMAKTLLQFGANLQAEDAIGQSPLHKARASSIIKILVEKGMKVNTKGDRGNTPLHCASSDYDAELIKTLLSLGADPTIRNKDGKTPRDLAEPQSWQSDQTPLKLLREAEWRFVPKNAGDKDEDKNETVKSEGEIPPTVTTTMEKNTKDKEKVETQRASNKPQQENISGQDKNNRLKCQRNKKTSHQTAAFKQEKAKAERWLKDVSDWEMGQIASVLNKKQAKLLRKLVPVTLKHTIGEDERGNCRNEYFHLLKGAQLRNRKMSFDIFKRKIALTRPYFEKMSEQEKTSMEKEIERLQLNKISIRNLSLVSRLSMVGNREYFLLGIELGLSSESMAEIHSLIQESLAERCHQTLRKTKERFPKKTCGDVVRAFANLGLDYRKAMELLEGSEHYTAITYS